MRNLLRKPLTWMIVAECALVAALVMVAWHLVAASGVPEVPIAPGGVPPRQAGQTTGPISANPLGQPTPRAITLLPGLNVDPNFWRSRLAALNGEQTAFEQLEWKLVHVLMDAAHRYVETVVLPSIARAERGGA